MLENMVDITTNNQNPSGFRLDGSKRDNFVYLTLLTMGYCFGLAWSVITNSSKVFEEKLAGTDYAQTFLTQFSTIYQAVSFLFILMSVKLSAMMQVHTQIIISIHSLIFLMVFFGIICSIEYSNKVFFYLLTLTLSLFVSFFSALFKAGSFGVVGHLSSEYLKALFIGEGISSVVMSAYSLLMACFFNPKTQTLSLINFGMASVIIFKSLVLYLTARKRPILLINKDETRKNTPTTHKPMIAQMKEVSREIIIVFTSTLVSLFIFPYLIICSESSIESQFYRDRIFRPLAFLLFSSGDLLGKSLPAFFNFGPFFGKHLMKMVIGRLIFIPLFLLGNFQIKGHRLLPNLLGCDFIFFILIFLTSLSGGFTSTLICLIAPKKFLPEERGPVNTIMSAFAALGNLCGSLSASLFAYFLNKSF
jgi:solute carrier family 29 (equilibrative nucleoside transporter), member 1/2/3